MTNQQIYDLYIKKELIRFDVIANTFLPTTMMRNFKGVTFLFPMGKNDTMQTEYKLTGGLFRSSNIVGHHFISKMKALK